MSPGVRREDLKVGGIVVYSRLNGSMTWVIWGLRGPLIDGKYTHASAVAAFVARWQHDSRVPDVFLKEVIIDNKDGRKQREVWLKRRGQRVV
jgi:hypothetical protein